MFFQKTAKLQQRRSVLHALTSQIDDDETPQLGAVQQGIFTGLICQVNLVLHEVHAQHALQPDWRTSG